MRRKAVKVNFMGFLPNEIIEGIGKTDINNGWLVVVSLLALTLGALECFAGYKTMRVMIGFWGLFVGAIAGVAAGILCTGVIIPTILAIVCGLGLAVISYKFYNVGMFTVVAALAFLSFYLLTESVVISAVTAVLVGAAAIVFTDIVVIIATSVSGGALIAVSACMLFDSSFDIQLYVMYMVWVFMAVSGMICQHLTSGVKAFKIGMNIRRKNKNTLSYSERRYPGLQRAYRNFCINCGYELTGEDLKCPRCRYEIKD